jgi:hypothetical protein
VTNGEGILNRLRKSILNRSDQKKNESKDSLEKSGKSVAESARYRYSIRKLVPSVIISEDSSDSFKKNEDLEAQLVE